MKILNKKFFKKNKSGFTLVELIIVITILAILATIAFISFQGYSKDSRDANRLSVINSVGKGVDIYYTQTSKYPTPEDYIQVISSGTTIGYQGYFGDNNSRAIKMNKTPLDPLDNTKYTYLTNLDGNAYQIVGFFETPSNVAFENNLLPKTYAGNIDYSSRIVKSFGKELGVLLLNTGSDLNRPLQEKYNVSSFTGIDVKTFTGTLSSLGNIGNLKAIFNNKETDNIVGTGSKLSTIELSYKQKIRLIMLGGCISGWGDKGVMSARDSNTGDVDFTQIYKICEGSITTSIKTIMPGSCATGWSDKGTISATDSSSGDATFNQIFKVCEGSNISAGVKTLMPGSCATGWSDKGTMSATDSYSGPVDFDQTYKICQKN